MLKVAHSYHLVGNSPWPLITSISILSLLIGTVMTFHIKLYGEWLTILSLISIIISAYYWWQEVVIEGVYIGDHTKKVQQNLTFGFILFVVSEIALFFSLFVAYFYNSLVPSVEIGGIFPPIGIETFNYMTIPLLNTAILFISGITVTAVQHYIISNNKKYSIFYLFITILLGIIFTFFQFLEYYNASFTITDGVFPSGFFTLTSFHGAHVIIGTLFLLVGFFRLILNHFTDFNSLGINFSNLYWHFVDIVWVLLYLVVYIWSSN